MLVLVLINVNLHTKFDVPFTCSRDITRAPKSKNGSRDPVRAHLRVICHPKTNTWYSPPVYKIWQL